MSALWLIIAYLSMKHTKGKQKWLATKLIWHPSIFFTSKTQPPPCCDKLSAIKYSHRCVRGQHKSTSNPFWRFILGKNRPLWLSTISPPSLSYTTSFFLQIQEIGSRQRKEQLQLLKALLRISKKLMLKLKLMTSQPTHQKSTKLCLGPDHMDHACD